MIINLRTGDVVVNNKRIHLTKYEVLALSALNKPDLTTLEEIYESVYKAKPNELKEYDKRQIYVLLCRLKKKIKEVIEIKSINGYGYRLKIRE